MFWKDVRPAGISPGRLCSMSFFECPHELGQFCPTYSITRQVGRRGQLESSFNFDSPVAVR